jgi:hypothetical protein
LVHSQIVEVSLNCPVASRVEGLIGAIALIERVGSLIALAVVYYCWSHRLALGRSESLRGLTETAGTVLTWSTAETILSADTVVNLIVHNEVWCV